MTDNIIFDDGIIAQTKSVYVNYGDSTYEELYEYFLGDLP